jgi:hypothetical protein
MEAQHGHDVLAHSVHPVSGDRFEHAVNDAVEEGKRHSRAVLAETVVPVKPSDKRVSSPDGLGAGKWLARMIAPSQLQRFAQLGQAAMSCHSRARRSDHHIDAVGHPTDQDSELACATAEVRVSHWRAVAEGFVVTPN